MDSALDYFVNKNTDEILLLLKQYPGIVHEKDSNGETPLHKAVMDCNIQVVDLLLEYKADPNIQNDAGETPFHLACRRADLQLMYVLLQNNADVNLVDQAGMGAVHHAAYSGSVLALHFLSEICGLSTKAQDIDMNTPLHIVCAHDHREALNYLLKKERSDLFAHNVYGNTSMHLAANTGSAWSCWRLLEEGGLGLLHAKNREGRRPLDVVRNKTDIKYIETIRLLTYYTQHKQKSGRPKGPVLGWYFNAILPVFSYPLLLILSYQTPRPGAITAEGMFLMAIAIVLHSASLNHMSRWPNPVYFSLFLAGVGHSHICFYCTVLPIIHDEHRLLLMVMFPLNIALVSALIVLLTRDPGLAKESAKKPSSVEVYSIQDIADGTLPDEAFCVYCELIPLGRSHHCRICRGCYIESDHHCVFLYRCIARNNHRLFVVFIFGTIVAMMLFLYSLILYFTKLYPGRQFDRELMIDIFNERPWHWSMLFGNTLCLAFGFVNLWYALIFVSWAQPSALDLDKSSRLTYKQRLYNVVYFFMGFGLYAFDAQNVNNEFRV